MILVDVSFKGVKRAIKKMEQFEHKMKLASDEAIKEAGELVAADAKANAPADSGDYRKGIRSILIKTRNGSFAKIASFFRGNPSPLGHLLEFGHRDKTTGRFVNGKAHLLPALERHKERIAGRIREGIGA